MAKWRRHGRRASVPDGSWWTPTCERRGGDDGAAGASAVGVGIRCDYAVAASAELAACAPVVVEAENAAEGTEDRQTVDADSTPVLE